MDLTSLMVNKSQSLKALHKITKVKERNYCPNYLHNSAGKMFSLRELVSAFQNLFQSLSLNFKKHSDKNITIVGKFSLRIYLHYFIKA